MPVESTDDRPWFEERWPHPSSAGWSECGHLDLRSGRLRISAAEDFMRNPALDDWLPSGQWRVQRCSAAPDDDPQHGCVIRLSSGSPALHWRRATADGRPAKAPHKMMLVGDADWSLTLGPKDEALEFLTLGSYGVKAEWTWPAGDSTQPLLPTSRTSSYFAGRHGLPGVPLDASEVGWAPVWAGTDESGEVCEVVIDLHSAARTPPGSILSAWNEPVGRGGVRLIVPPDEVADSVLDLSAAFEVTPDFMGTLTRLGAVRLAGRVAAYDPGTRLEPVLLPISVEEHDYPVFTVVTDEHGTEDLLVIRVGDGRPKQWVEQSSPGHGWNVLIDTGRYVVTSEDVWRLVMRDKQAHHELLSAIDQVGHGCGDIAALSGGVVVNDATFGDGVASCFLALGQAGEVLAIAFSMLPDLEWSVMPARDDQAVFGMLAERVRTGPLHDDEIATYRWPSLLNALEKNQGQFTRQVRAEMYGLKDHIENERE